jgi:hypothetical protein
MVMVIVIPCQARSYQPTTLLKTESVRAGGALARASDEADKNVLRCMGFSFVS